MKLRRGVNSAVGRLLGTILVGWAIANNQLRRMKTLREIVLLVSILGCGSVYAYVGIRWPYEPLGVIGDRYLDKRGATYSRQEYLHYLAWSSFMWKTIFLGIGVNAVLLGTEALTRLRSKSALRDKIPPGDHTEGDN